MFSKMTGNPPLRIITGKLFVLLRSTWQWQNHRNKTISQTIKKLGPYCVLSQPRSDSSERRVV